MAARLDSVCKQICSVGDWKVTNLQLQKVLYILQMISLGQTGERLAEARFEAWDYGPVEPTAYRKVRMFGSEPIQDVFWDARVFKAGDSRLEMIKAVAGDLLKMRPGELVEITHWDGGAWAKHYVPGARGIQIPNDDIKSEYRERLRSGKRFRHSHQAA